MSDWFDRAYEDYMAALSEELGIELSKVKYLYTRLAEDGLIDYDTEKEVFYEMYGDEEEDE